MLCWGFLQCPQYPCCYYYNHHTTTTSHFRLVLTSLLSLDTPD